MRLESGNLRGLPSLKRPPKTKRSELRKTNTGNPGTRLRRTALGADASVTLISLMSRASKVVAWPNGSQWQADGRLRSNNHPIFSIVFEFSCSILCMALPAFAGHLRSAVLPFHSQHWRRSQDYGIEGIPGAALFGRSRPWTTQRELAFV